MFRFINSLFEKLDTGSRITEKVFSFILSILFFFIVFSQNNLETYPKIFLGVFGIFLFLYSLGILKESGSDGGSDGDEDGD
jgi:hypothetical protein